MTKIAALLGAWLLTGLGLLGLGQLPVSVPGPTGPVAGSAAPVGFQLVATSRLVGVTNAATGQQISFTTPADGTYLLDEVITVTSGTTFSFSGVYTFTNENSVLEGGNLLDFNFNSGQFVTVIANTLGAGGIGTMAGRPVMFRAKSGTLITAQTSTGGTYTSVVYNFEARLWLVGS